jgi:hypothetical protein
VNKIVIPFTPMMALHYRMARRPLPTVAAQCATAEAWAADPSELIDAYIESVRLFQTYANPKEHFLNLRPDGTPHRDPLPKPPSLPVANTDALVSWIDEHSGFGISEHPELQLGVDYVEREVSVIKTRNAMWDDPEAQGSAGRALQPDLLLRTRDGTPAIGEIKVTRPGRATKSGALGQPNPDKDPLAALVQALAAVAHLATPPQYARLRTFFPQANFTEPGPEGPRLDVYLVEYNHGGIPWIEEIACDVRTISKAVTRHPEVSKTLRRVVFVELFVENEALRSTLHWIAPRAAQVRAS